MLCLTEAADMLLRVAAIGYVDTGYMLRVAAIGYVDTTRVGPGELEVCMPSLWSEVRH